MQSIRLVERDPRTYSSRITESLRVKSDVILEAVSFEDLM